MRKEWILIATTAFLALQGCGSTHSLFRSKNKSDTTTVNPSGGDTAHVSNIEIPPRKLSETEAVQLDAFLAEYKDRKVIVRAVWGDEEALQYARQFFEHLKSKGFQMADEAVVFSPELNITGQEMKVFGDHILITIGVRQ